MDQRDYVRALTCGTLSVVDDDVLIGGYVAAADPAKVKRHRVTHILKLFEDDHGYKGGYHRHPGVKYLVVGADDTPEFALDDHFHVCIKFIQEAIREGGTVLVHCHAGVSRSATIVLLHRMINHGERLGVAMRHLRSRRPFVQPNEGFWGQLQDVDVRIAKLRRSGQFPRRPRCMQRA